MSAIAKGAAKGWTLRRLSVLYSTVSIASLLPGVLGPPTMVTLVGSFSLPETAVNGTVAGTLVGVSIGSTLSLFDNAGGRIALSGANLVRTATGSTDYDAGTTSLSVTVRETNAGATNGPTKDTVLTVSITNVNDTNPSAFTFTDQTSVVLSSLRTSNTITIAGLGASDSVTASISGNATSQFQKNGGSWGTTPVSVVNTDTLAVRHNAAATNATQVDTTLTVGTTSDTFSSTTAASGSGLTAPTFQIWNGTTDVTSATGVADPVPFDFTIPDSSEGEADVVEQRVESGSALSGTDLQTEERVLLWDGTNFEFALTDLTLTPQNFTTQTGLNPAKHWYVSRRFRRDLGDTSIYSSWTTVDFTLAAAGITFAWNPSNKSTWDSTHQTLSNSNRTWTVTPAAGGANSSIRATLNVTGNGTKVYWEYNPDVWDTASAGLIGLATDTYGGTGSPGSLASVGDALANLSQTAGLQGSGADLYVANSYVTTPAGVDISPVNHALGFALRVNASDMTLWVLQDGVCGHGNPVAGTGGYTLPFTQVRPIVALNPNGGANQGVTINTLAAATTRAPSGFTPAGA